MISRKKNTTSRLRYRMTLQKEVQTGDGAGGYTRSWSDIADIWAEIAILGGKESFFAAKLQSSISHKVTIRFRDDITAGQRLVHDTRLFNIRYVCNVAADNEILELLVEEGVAT